MQIVQQVQQAISVGMLRAGDQLPTVKEAVGALAIDPNTVLKAYRELERAGFVEARRGHGTFVARDGPRPGRGRSQPAARRPRGVGGARSLRWPQRRGDPSFGGLDVAHRAQREGGRMTPVAALRCDRLGKQMVLPRIGFVARDHPPYRSFTLGEMLSFGRRMNSRWDDGFARRRLTDLSLELGHRAGKLSGGQQAQLALTLGS